MSGPAMVNYRFLLKGGAVGAGYATLVYLISPTDSVPVGDAGSVALGLIQLIALFAPALALFMQALLRYASDKENRQGRSYGVAQMEFEVFHLFVIFGGFVSSAALITGLLVLLNALALPAAIDRAVIFIVIGLALVPFMLGVVVYLEYSEVGTEVV